MRAAGRAIRTRSAQGALKIGLFAGAVLSCSDGDGAHTGLETAETSAAAPTAPEVADPGRKEMHRLNSNEYNATVHDVLGTLLEPANANWRGGELAGFDNMAAVLGVDEAQYERYLDAAKALATELFASDGFHARFAQCNASEPTCARPTIEAAGLRLFRRPLSAEELTTYQHVYDAALSLGDPPAAALQLTFVALLSSAEFLYRIEVDAEPSSAEPHALSPYELASRLSYFLWSSAPDGALLQAAADASLLRSDVLASTVDRMLDDPKSERFIANFAGQWLGAREVLSHPVATGVEQWTPELARGASNELLLYFSDFLRSERSWLEFLTADFNYVNDWLAIHYGMRSPRTPTERVEVTSDERAGFFGLAGFLALSSFDRRTSPSLRGRWIAGNFLCAEPPTPPPNVPKLTQEGVDASQLDVRQSLQLHSSNPDCSGCHSLFDPYGLALEEFDALGQHRTTYADGSVIDTSASLPATPEYPEGQGFSGLAGLATVVTGDPRFTHCVTQKLFTYSLGRVVTATDAPHLEAAHQAWTAPGQVPTLRRLVQALVATDAFRARRGDGAEVGP